MKILISLLALLHSGICTAQPVLIRNATVHTLTAAAPLEQTDILIEDGIVRQIGRALDNADDVTELDAAGRAVTPGMFGGITSMGIAEISLEPSSMDNQLDLTQFRPEFNIMPAYNPNSALVGVTRVEGITSTLVAPVASGSIIAGTGNVVALDGRYAAAISPAVLFINIGGDVSQLSGGSRAAQFMLLQQSLDEAASRKDINGHLRLLTEAGKTALTEFTSSSKITVFQVDRASDILQVMAFAREHGMKAVIQGGVEAWMVAPQIAEAGVPVVLNPLDNEPDNFDQLAASMENAARLHAAGVTIAFSLDAESHNARKVRQAAGNAVAYGLPWAAGLAAITRNPAQIFGYSGRGGTIEVGKSADLVVWSGDPLEVTSFADQVFLAGTAISMESRQTRLRDRYLPEKPGKPRAYIQP